LTGREAESQEALQSYLALPSAGLKTIAAWKAQKAAATNPHGDPRWVEFWDQLVESLVKAGMPAQ
jgi:hypothetical protein